MIATATQAETATEISPDVLYSREEFARRTGMGQSALRIARTRGLKVRKAGKRIWILGRDFIDYVTAVANARA